MRPNERWAYGRNSGQCNLIDAISPIVVPTSSQTVPHARYSNVTRTVAWSTEGEAVRPGSRIRVLTAVMRRGGSKPRANAKVLSLLRLAVLGSQISRENSRNSTAARPADRIIRAVRSRIGEWARCGRRPDRGRAAAEDTGRARVRPRRNLQAEQGLARCPA